MTNSRGWIGCDLDGTLAEYGNWQGPEHIGTPIPKMVERIKKHLADGWTVKIVTARVARKEFAVEYAIRQWCKEHLGQELEVTNAKDYGMVFLYDDRAIQVVPNTGELVQEQLDTLRKEHEELKFLKKNTLVID